MGKRVSGITEVRGYVRLTMVTLNLRRRDANYKETELVSSQFVITMAQKTVLIKGIHRLVSLTFVGSVRWTRKETEARGFYVPQKKLSILQVVYKTHFNLCSILRNSVSK